ncbi:hypothetical protein DSM104443_00256 [Usitatibacter rugosus]|uniref:Uncharacterized protein n=1 Tax=Usitatibacter rugosus TaxID=2732067 RepID=A0A6M4GPF8_9PROT|nr:hypothetical protein DSM104443_00256 [Usitatibacter rugosus]
MFLLIFGAVYVATYQFIGHREKECQAKCQAAGHKSYRYEDFSGTYRRPESDRCTCV